MRRSLFIALGIFLSVLGAQAQQELVKTAAAIELCQSEDYISAREQIMEALKDPVESSHPYSWYVKGFIYKEIYKNIEKGNRASNNRDVAVDAILKSMKLDPENKYLESNKAALKYLSQSYHNDAVIVIQNMTYENHDEAIKYYTKFKDLFILYDPTFDFTETDVKVFLNMAGSYRELYNLDKDKNKIYIDRSSSIYDVILELQPDHYIALYNKSINLYNQGAYKISKINYQTEIFELIMIQDECLKLFKESLPFMLLAHEQQPERYETLKGLMAIYRAMHEREKSDYYMSEIERLTKEGKIKIEEKPKKD